MISSGRRAIKAAFKVDWADASKTLRSLEDTAGYDSKNFIYRAMHRAEFEQAAKTGMFKTHGLRNDATLGYRPGDIAATRQSNQAVEYLYKIGNVEDNVLVRFKREGLHYQDLDRTGLGLRGKVEGGIPFENVDGVFRAAAKSGDSIPAYGEQRFLEVRPMARKHVTISNVGLKSVKRTANISPDTLRHVPDQEVLQESNNVGFMSTAAMRQKPKGIEIVAQVPSMGTMNGIRQALKDFDVQTVDDAAKKFSPVDLDNYLTGKMKG